MRRSAAFLSLIAVLLISAVAAFGDGTTGSEADKPQSDKLTWEVPCDMTMAVQPLLARGYLPIQQKARGAQKPHLALLRLADGKIMWSIELSSDVAAINAEKDIITLALSDRIAAVTFLEGKVLWQEPVQGILDAGWQTSPRFKQSQWFSDLRTCGQGIGGVLFMMKGRVYITVGGILYAFDAASGKEIWEQKYGFSLSFPILGMNGLVFAASNEGLTAYNADTGSLVWRDEDLKRSDPIFVIDDELYAADDVGFLKLNPSTGKAIWTQDIKRDSAENLYAFENRLVLQRDADVWVLDRATGDKVWSEETGHQLSAYSNGRVFLLGREGGDIQCYSVKAGDYAWHTGYAQNNLGRVFAAGSVVIATNGFGVVAYDAEKGEMLWQRQAPPGELFDTATWAASDKAVYYKSAGWVYGCDPRKGSWVTAVTGHFFFVHWMWTNGEGLFLHSGDPGLSTIGGLFVKDKR
jgi:outer membrane protein assembly factor BamB